MKARKRRNPGSSVEFPDSASLHPGYAISFVAP
jgi:hypothetical protein